MALPALAILGIKAAPAVGAAAYKFFSGNKQVKDGERIAKNNKFINYKRPPEVTQALNLSERNYLNGMPGSDLLQNRIGSNAATAFTNASEGASSSADVLDAATKIGVGTNRAMQDLSLQEQNFEQNALQGYTNQLGRSADYADEEFKYNIAKPYQMKAAAASALIGAGNQNKWSGVDDFAGAATEAIRTGFGMPNQKSITDGSDNANLPMFGASSLPKISIPGIAQTEQSPNLNFGMGQPRTLGTGFSSSSLPDVKLKSAGFSNPYLMGKWIVDPTTGSKRWSINGI